MLTSIALKRFKSICNEKPLPLDLFSILCGSNSSGKSSLIQAILFLSQSLSSRHDKTSFVLNGHLIKLGAIGDVRSHFTNDKSVEISFTLTTGKLGWQIENGDRIEIRLLLAKRNSYDGSLDDELHPIVIESDVTFLSRRDSRNSLQTLSVIDKNFDKVPESKFIESSSLFEITNIDLDSIKTLAEEYPGLHPKGFRRESFIPKVLVFEYDKTKRIADRLISTICGSTRNSLLSNNYMEIDESSLPLTTQFFLKLRELIGTELEELDKNFEFPEALVKALKANQVLQRSIDYQEVKKQFISQKFPLSPKLFEGAKFQGNLSVKSFKQFISELPREASDSLIDLIKKNGEQLKAAWYNSSPKEVWTESTTLPLLDAIENYIIGYFSRSVKYLGPLRIEPQANYPGTGLADPKNVGLKGENTAAVLHVNRGRNIRYYSGDESADGHLQLTPRATPLHEACKVWLSYLGVANDFHTVDTGKMGHLLQVKTNTTDRWQDLTHVGVGVSQVLPIILMALLSDSGDMLIFEQPELHLHPRVQSRLCDFFIAMALSGRQCLIETHSEYIITRLRARIAQSDDEAIKNISSIYFIDKTNGVSQFAKVDISRFGAFENWPKDFFDDNNKEVEMIIREAAYKRKRERQLLQSATKDIKED